jgi:hypothetical protein
MRFLIIASCVVFIFICHPIALAGYGHSPSAIEQAEADVQVAESRANDAGAHLTAIVNGLRKTFESSADFAKAKKELDDATRIREAERSRVLDQLHGTAAYQQAVTDRNNARQAVEDARSDGNPKEIVTAATNALNATTAVTKMDSDALANDADYQAATEGWSEANSVMRTLEDQFKTSLAANPDWQHAKADFDKASTDLAAAAAQAQKISDTMNSANKPGPLPISHR